MSEMWKYKKERDMKLCYKCLTPSEENITRRKYKGKLMETTTHQCTKKGCGSYTFYSGGNAKK